MTLAIIRNKMMKNIFEAEVSNEFVERINKLEPSSKQQWGKMNVGQMLAHCNVTYEYIYDNKHPQPKGLRKFILKKFVKPIVVGEKTYAKNSRTAPDFIITDEKEFEAEKKRLIDFMNKTQELGANHFDGKESHSFGKLTTAEWNNMFVKHLDHHLEQFGV